MSIKLQKHGEEVKNKPKTNWKNKWDNKLIKLRGKRKCNKNYPAHALNKYAHNIKERKQNKQY